MVSGEGETTEGDEYIVVTTGGELWRCRGCGQVLGVVVAGGELWLSLVVVVEERVRLRCRCGRLRTWRPAPAGGERGEWNGEVRRVGEGGRAGER